MHTACELLYFVEDRKWPVLTFTHKTNLTNSTMHQTNIPQSIILSQKCAHVCTCKVVYCGIKDWCIVGFLWQINSSATQGQSYIAPIPVKQPWGTCLNVSHESTWTCNDVTMDAMASQITNLTIVYSTVYSGADQRKHQSSASLAFLWGIHRWPVNCPHKWPVTRKIFPFHDVIM